MRPASLLRSGVRSQPLLNERPGQRRVARMRGLVARPPKARQRMARVATVIGKLCVVTRNLVAERATAGQQVRVISPGETSVAGKMQFEMPVSRPGQFVMARTRGVRTHLRPLTGLSRPKGAGPTRQEVPQLRAVHPGCPRRPWRRHTQLPRAASPRRVKKEGVRAASGKD